MVAKKTARLQLRLAPDLLYKAQMVAKQKGSTLTQLVEDYFRMLPVVQDAAATLKEDS